VFSRLAENVRSQQLINWQWIPDCWSGNRKSTAFTRASANTWDRQSTTPGRSKMLASGNFGIVVGDGEISWSPVLKATMDRHGELVYCTVWGTVSQWRSSCISYEKPDVSPSDQMCCSIQNGLQLESLRYRNPPKTSCNNRPPIRQKHEQFLS